MKSPGNRPRSAHIRTVLLVGIYAAVWFGSLGVRPLFDPDEGRYAEIPREMFASGDWVTPRLNGFVYFEKPPMQYWATATFYRLFGVSPLSSRLWPATTGFLLLLLTGWGGGRLFGERAGRMAALVLAGCVLYVGLGVFDSLDTAVTLFLGAALIFFALAQSRRDKPRFCRGAMLLTWLAMALAVLSKGLIGVAIPGGTLLVYSLWSRDWRVWKHLHLRWGLLILVAVAAPWFVLVSHRNPDFLRFFFLREHLERFLTDEHQRGKPWFFFLLILPVGLLPFTVPAIRALVESVRRRVSRGEFDAGRLVAAWCLFVLIFFSLSESKLVGYIGPMLPGLALLAGAALAANPLRDLRISARTAVGVAGLLLLAAVFLPLANSDRLATDGIDAFRSWLAGAGGILLLGALLALGFLRRERALAGLYGVSLASAAAIVTLFLGLGRLMPDRSSEEVATFIRDHARPGAKIYMVNEYDQSLPFYLERLVTLVRYRGELEYGVAMDPDRWVPSFPEFARVWTAEEDALAVVPAEDLNRLEELGIPMKILFRTPLRVVLGRQTDPTK